MLCVGLDISTVYLVRFIFRRSKLNHVRLYKNFRRDANRDAPVWCPPLSHKTVSQSHSQRPDLHSLCSTLHSPDTTDIRFPQTKQDQEIPHHDHQSARFVLLRLGSAPTDDPAPRPRPEHAGRRGTGQGGRALEQYTRPPTTPAVDIARDTTFHSPVLRRSSTPPCAPACN